MPSQKKTKKKQFQRTTNKPNMPKKSSCIFTSFFLLTNCRKFIVITQNAGVRCVKKNPTPSAHRHAAASPLRTSPSSLRFRTPSDQRCDVPRPRVPHSASTCREKKNARFFCGSILFLWWKKNPQENFFGRSRGYLRGWQNRNKSCGIKNGTINLGR